MKKILLANVLIILTVFISCSKDEETSEIDFNNMKFEINKNGINIEGISTVSFSDFKNHIVGKSWQYTGGHEILEDGTISDYEYNFRYIGQRPFHYCFTTDSTVTIINPYDGGCASEIRSFDFNKNKITDNKDTLSELRLLDFNILSISNNKMTAIETIYGWIGENRTFFHRYKLSTFINDEIKSDCEKSSK